MPIYLGTGKQGCKIFGARISDKVFDSSDDPATPEYDAANYLWNVNMSAGNLPDDVKDLILSKAEKQNKPALASRLEQALNL